MGNQTVHEDSFKYKYKLSLKNLLSQNKYIYKLKIAGRDQASFGPVPILMVVKIIWSAVYEIKSFVHAFEFHGIGIYLISAKVCVNRL